MCLSMSSIYSGKRGNDGIVSRAYHSSINSVWNLAEATNPATEDWI